MAAVKELAFSWLSLLLSGALVLPDASLIEKLDLLKDRTVSCQCVHWEMLFMLSEMVEGALYL